MIIINPTYEIKETKYITHFTIYTEEEYDNIIFENLCLSQYAENFIFYVNDAPINKIRKKIKLTFKQCILPNDFYYSDINKVIKLEDCIGDV